MGDVRIYDSIQEPIGVGKVVIDTSINEWTAFQIQINYTGNHGPVSCALFFTITDSTLLSSGQAGSFFLLDELSMYSTVGINNLKNEKNISIYPNPVHTKIHIVNQNAGNDLSFSLSDISGKICLTKTHCQPDEIINTEDLAPGLYLLTGKSDKNYFTKKIVVE